MEILYLLILLLTVIVLAYKRVPLLVAMAIMVGLTVFWTELRHLIYVPGWFRFANGIVAVILIGFSIKPSRRLLISDRLYGWFRKSLPRMSTTEREALDAGTVWWDAEIFSGRCLMTGKFATNIKNYRITSGPSFVNTACSA